MYVCNVFLTYISNFDLNYHVSVNYTEMITEKLLEVIQETFKMY